MPKNLNGIVQESNDLEAMQDKIANPEPSIPTQINPAPAPISTVGAKPQPKNLSEFISQLQDPSWKTWGNATNNFIRDNNRKPANTGELLDYLQKDVTKQRQQQLTTEQSIQVDVDQFRIAEMRDRYGKTQDTPKGKTIKLFGQEYSPSVVIHETPHAAEYLLGAVIFFLISKGMAKWWSRRTGYNVHNPHLTVYIPLFISIGFLVCFLATFWK